jgi:hypothetical protein
VSEPGAVEDAALVDERDHLLASLEDLEAEHDAGDLDDADYETLRDDYTARAAAVLRRLDGDVTERDAATADAPRTVTGGSAGAEGPPGWRRFVIAAVVLAFAVGAGVLVAQSAGQRGGGTLTGNDDTLRARLANCQPLAFSDPPAGVECYDDVLATSPDNVEALTYQGWALVRAGDVAAGSERFDAAVRIDPEYPDVHVFRAIVASRAAEAARRRGDVEAARAAYETAAEELAAFYRNDPPEVARQVLRQELLELKVFLGLLNDSTSRCWTDTITARGEDLSFDQRLYDELAACLDTVLAAEPGNVDALVSRGIASLGPDRPDLAGAARSAQLARAVDASSPDAVLLAAAVALAEGRLDDSEALLAQLGSGPWPTSAFLLGTPQELTDVIAAARRAAQDPAPEDRPSGSAPPDTSSGVVTNSVPGAPPIPNAGGG